MPIEDTNKVFGNNTVDLDGLRKVFDKKEQEYTRPQKTQTPKKKIRVQAVSSNLEQIHNKSSNIDLEKVGHHAGEMIYNHDTLKQLVVAGIMNKLNRPTEQHIAIRKIIPKLDFILHDDSFPKNNTWKIKIKKNNYEFDIVDQYVYRTDEKKTNMDWKCIVLYGLEYIPSQTVIDEVQVWITGTKLIDKFILNHLPTSIGYCYFSTPIIFGLDKKQDSNIGISVTLIDGIDENEYHEDYLKLQGFVAEPLGINTSD